MLLSFLFLPLLLSSTEGNFSLNNSSSFSIFNQQDEPHECPPCFNCMLPEQFPCLNYAECSPFSGRCECPTGFGGDNCSQPVCGALSDGEERSVRIGNHCECKDGWQGINCNVCNSDSACDAMMPPGLNGTCYRGGLTVNSNYQQCNVTNPKIIELLHGPLPQVTFSCDRTERECKFQFWVDEMESFYCSLDQCEFRLDNSYDRNVTVYECPEMKCSCVPGEFLCGKDGSVDITEFLTNEIKGPGRFTCDTSTGCKFEEPAMNQLISDIFGDGYISLQCDSGECLHYSQVPGFVRPPPPDRTVAIAVAIGVVVAFLLVTILLAVWLVRKSRKDETKYRLMSTSAEDEDLGNKFLDDHIPANLMFTNVNYWVAEKQVLRGIYGNVKPGQVMAIMGASGAGKTSFLDILARRTKSGTVTGDFFVNGTNADDAEFKRVVGYVDQEDTLMPTLTVYETILYSALLRLPRDMSDDAKKVRVMETMTELGIMKIRDNRIGDTGSRGISGGEKRRVSIACELVTSPSILFLDEPTSGLDSYNAYNVVECLVTLARNYNRTVICTIHQPRSNIYALFDQLVLLASGRLVYSGNAQEVRDHFERIGHPCPPGFNIADFAVDLTMHAISHDDADEGGGSRQRNGKNFRSRYSVRDEESALGSGSGSGRTGNAGPSASSRSKRGKSVRSQQEQDLYTPHPVSSRPTSPAGGGSTVEYWENQVSKPIVASSSPGSGNEFVSEHLSLLIEGYAQCETARRLREEIHSVAGETTIGPHRIDRLIISAGYQRSSWLTQFRILSDRTMKNLYRNPSLMLTHYVISLITALTCGSLFFRVTNDIAGFQNRMGVMFFLCALLGFGCLTSLQVLSAERILFVRERANGYYSPFTYFASKVLFDVVPLRVVPPLLLGIIVYPMVGLNAEPVSWAKFLLVLVLFNLTAAAVCLFVGIAFRDLGVASLVSSLVMLFAMLFGGLLLNKDSLPASMQWAKDVSFFHSAFEAMMVNEMVYLQLTERKYGLEIDVPGATILSTFGLDVTSYWSDVGKLFFTFAVFVVGSFVWLQKFVREKR